MAAFEAMRPGVPCREVDAAARAVVERAGFGAGYTTFTHRLGHGIGLDGHEPPYFDGGDPTPLEPGMVLCLERTIRSADGYLGDFEETVVVTDTGCEIITDAQKRFW
jgi:Xaa-Pro dipeptidase